LSKIFDSTQHLTTYGTNGETGSGIGLNLCRDYTIKNEGEIWVESIVENGTSFFLKLPASGK
jgi:signal transduction histidine kinase